MMCVALTGSLFAQATMTIDVDKPGHAVSPLLWGIFFEDINLGADGGLYAELVKNRSFEFTNAIMGWTQITNHNGGGDLDFYHDDPVNLINPRYLRVTSTGPGDFGVANEGFRGMGVKEGDTYDFSTQARAADGTQPNLRVEIADGDGKVLASGKLSGLTTKWQKQSLKLTPSGTEAKAHLNVYVEGKGTVDLDNVSLFPEKTWKNRPGGLRADMVQLLADLHPGFLRFPGGCIV